MGRDDEDGFSDSNLELLHTQVIFLGSSDLFQLSIYIKLVAYVQGQTG